MNLHLGCGPILLPGWINVDHSSHWNPDMVFDYQKLSDYFPEGTADLVFACHTLEHCEYPSGVIGFLNQVYRVLRPGGTLRIVVPDLMKVARAYVSGSDLKNIYEGKFFYHKDCPAERFLYFMREWQHTIVFDEPLLRSFMGDAGFNTIRLCEHGKSHHADLRGIDRYESESMSIECQK